MIDGQAQKESFIGGIIKLLTQTHILIIDPYKSNPHTIIL